ncbi:MAG: 4-hydroxy-tetrahydrodipicolinate reductase [Myxococcales bacterium]|nr:4-hydroxy-tetrahydrodipicolinate reductase [Myxococcales bacterium]
MGLTVARLAHAAGDEIVGAVAAEDDTNLGRDLGELAGLGTLGVAVGADAASGLLGAEVVVDFSTARAIPALLATAARQKVAVVTGTTNLDAAGKAALERAAELVPVLWAPNMSLGVQVLADLVTEAVRRLGPEYDVEIVEIHHRKKIDAPSGTAKRLAEAAKVARGGLAEIHARDGDVGARPTDEVGVFGVRGGDVVGEHTVYLLGPAERIELTHRASSRELFAHGALRAARFLVGKAPKLYSIADVLG